MNTILSDYFVVVNKAAGDQYRRMSSDWSSSSPAIIKKITGALSTSISVVTGQPSLGGSSYFKGEIGYDRVVFQVNFTQNTAPDSCKNTAFVVAIFPANQFSIPSVGRRRRSRKRVHGQNPRTE